MRDTQRAKLYRAQHAIDQYAIPLKSVEDVEAFVDKAWNNAWIKAKFPGATKLSQPRVKDGRGCRIARGCASYIKIPKWARNSRVVIHELAHSIVDKTYYRHGFGAPVVAGHGWEFCHTYLTLVLHMMGREAFQALRSSMQQHRVRFRPPRKRAPLSPERKAELAARLKRARQAKAVNAILIAAM